MTYDKNSINRLNASLQFATKSQFITFIFWDIFRPSKRDIVMKALEDGMHWMAAFNKAKNDGKKTV